MMNPFSSIDHEKAYELYRNNFLGNIVPDRKLYDFITQHADPKKTTLVFGLPVRFFSSETNHRNGDELVTNPQRDPVKRIIDHLNLNRKQSPLTLSSLGYKFHDLDNLQKFITLMWQAVEVMPEKTAIAFPINGEICIFGRDQAPFKTWGLPQTVFQGLS